MVVVSEFEQKHPRLAKIKNFFVNIKNKITNNKEEKEKKEEKEPVDKHKDFVRRLKDLDGYDISEVAEKGMAGVRDDRMSEAKERLAENKRIATEIEKYEHKPKAKPISFETPFDREDR